ncbi:phospholipid scramblase 1 [Xenopus laevis]|uniref:Phospholipid scramblase n=1 Tax=Xenopus laevis TaxID=8355 RepID=A0A8J1MV56_XENLA|nr:phospholipid scramblase 1 [Xenopus laevis]XP_041444911.1 phospholipid scramblase 1 [Xenopus laevis]
MPHGEQDPPQPIQTQPQWQSTSGTSHQDQYSRPFPVVPPGLESLVEVNEVLFRKKVFQTPDGQTLYSVQKDSECCGNPLILKLIDPHEQVVLHSHLFSESGCCKSYTELQVEAPQGDPIGFVMYQDSSRGLKFSISDEQREPIFTSQVKSHSFLKKPIEICSVQGTHPVGQISKIKGKPSKIFIQFPKDMEVKMKAVILATYLYMQYCVDKINSEQNSSTSNGGDWGGGGDLGDAGGWCDGGDGGACGGGGDGGACGGGDGGGE